MGGKKGGKKSKSKSKTAAQKAAAKRHAKFKQTRVQTFGGKKTSFSKAEQKRITDAGYSVSGYSKAAPRSNTAVQISKDNARYGNTFPSGSIGISPEGRQQAYENRARFAEANPKLASNVYYGGKDAENRRRLFKDLNEFERRDPTKGGEGWKGFKFTDKVVNKFKDFGTLLAGDYTSPNVTGYGLRPDGVTGSYKTGDIVNTGGLSGKDFMFNGRSWERVKAQADTDSDMSGMTASMDLSGIGMTPKASDYDPGSTAYAIRTGNYDPAAYENYKKNLAKGLNISDKSTTEKNDRTARTIWSKGLGAIDALTGNLGDFDGMGGQSALGRSISSAPENLKSGINTFNNVMSIMNSLPSNQRDGWSRTLGALDFASGLTRFGEQDFDKMGKGFTGRGIISPKDIVSDVRSGINQFGGGITGLERFTEAGLENVNDYNKIKDSDNRALAIAQNISFDQLQNALKFGDESKVVQKVGENLEAFTGQENVNLPSNFKTQVRNLVEGIQEKASTIEQGKTRQRLYSPRRVDEFNEVLKNINESPKLSLLSSVAHQFDPSGLKGEDLAKFNKQTPLQKIAAGFDVNSPKVKALSAKDRGFLGSAGNLIFGGKLSDMYREASGDIKGGVNAGIPQGQIGLSNSDMFNIATSAIQNINTPGTLSAKQADSIKALTGKGITAGSLIRSATGLGGRGTQSRPTLDIGGGSSSTPVEELLINQQAPTSPTTQQLQTGVGTDAGNLAELQRQAYLRSLASYGFNPNYFAQVRSPRFNPSPTSFSDYFRRTT